MPPTASSYNHRGFPMPAISVTKDEDSGATLYRDYSLVAILVNLASALVVSWILVYAFDRFRISDKIRKSGSNT
jgi:VanZ family protein